LLRFRIIILSLFVLLAQSARAQETSSLAGIVQDQSGAVINGAQITVISEGQGSSQSLPANDGGRYTVPFLPPGLYDIHVTAQGFRDFEQKGVVIQTAQRSTVNVTLHAGGPTQSITVVSNPELINTSDGSVGAVIDRTLVENIPLNGRSLQSLWTLVPGVTQAPTSQYAASPSLTYGTILVNGQRSQSNQFLVDGVSANVPAGSGAAFSPNLPGLNALGGTQGIVGVDELEEFNVLTATYSAEYGTSPGGQFSFTTRSGTNDLHGSLYEFFRNEDLDANDWFNNNVGFGRGELRQNDFGATLGGPIVFPHLYNGHDKAFFFASFEGLQLVTPISRLMQVPDTGLRETAAAALQPILNYFPVADGADLGDPCPNQPDPTYLCGLANYTLHVSQPSSIYTGALRIDDAITPTLQSFVRYTRSPSITSPVGQFDPNNASTLVTNQTLTAGLTWVPNHVFANDFRFNWSTTNSGGVSSPVFGGGLDLYSYLQRNSNDPPHSFSNIQFNIYNNAGEFEGQDSLTQSNSAAHSQQFNVVDTFSWTRGAHSLKFGGDMRRLNATLSPFQYQASTAFGGGPTGYGGDGGIEYIQQGIADYLATFSSVQPQPVFWDYGLFINDDWAASPRLRLQLGLRWDVNPVPGTVGGLSPVVFYVSPDLSTVTPQPAGTSLYKTKYNNFSPRVGLAYTLASHGNSITVFRGGFGLFYDTSDSPAAGPYSSVPFGGSAFNFGPEGIGIQFPFTADETAPPPVTAPLVPPYSGQIIAINPNLRLPLTYSWSGAIEQSLGTRSSITATYLGNRGSRLLQTIYNAANPSEYGSLSYTYNAADSSYNALQLQYQARLLRGVTAFAGYTWSHSIDDTGLQQTAQTYALVRGNSDGDQRNVFRLGLSYTTPKLDGGLRSLLLGEWGTDMNISVQSGLPFDLIDNYIYVANEPVQTTRPNIVPGERFWILNPGGPGGWQLNPNAFADPGEDANGNPLAGDLGRNVFHGFATGQADFDIRKDFSLTERVKLQFRAEAFNITNHPNFGEYDNFVGDSTLGVPESMLGTQLGGLSPLYQVGGPRSLQLALKLLF
jgi:outer membrane receptor protein involved in Fe transport